MRATRTKPSTSGSWEKTYESHDGMIVMVAWKWAPGARIRDTGGLYSVNGANRILREADGFLCVIRVYRSVRGTCMTTIRGGAGSGRRGTRNEYHDSESEARAWAERWLDRRFRVEGV